MPRRAAYPEPLPTQSIPMTWGPVSVSHAKKAFCVILVAIDFGFHLRTLTSFQCLEKLPALRGSNGDFSCHYLASLRMLVNSHYP